MIPMDNVNHLRVGILGGMGSYSSLHFLEQILDAFPVEKEWERPRIILDNHCTLPSRVVAALRDERRTELVDGMTSSIRQLLTYDPHLIAIPCNTAHCFLPEVRQRLDGMDDRVLDMIDVVAETCASEGESRVFLMATEGTIDTRVYDTYCNRRGVEVVYPEGEAISQIREFIEQVKQKKPLDVDAFADYVRASGQSTVILGCTELSLFPEALLTAKVELDGIRLIDPIALMVSRIVERSAQLAEER